MTKQNVMLPMHCERHQPVGYGMSQDVPCPWCEIARLTSLLNDRIAVSDEHGREIMRLQAVIADKVVTMRKIANDPSFKGGPYEEVWNGLAQTLEESAGGAAEPSGVAEVAWNHKNSAFAPGTFGRDWIDPNGQLSDGTHVKTELLDGVVTVWVNGEKFVRAESDALTAKIQGGVKVFRDGTLVGPMPAQEAGCEQWACANAHMRYSDPSCRVCFPVSRTGEQ